MKLPGFLAPSPTLSESDIARGMNWMVWEGFASNGLGAITGGGFLTALALLLGANNAQIGILAAIPFLMMPLQVLSVPVIERFRGRKLISVTAWLLAQSLWVPVALIPVLFSFPSAGAVSTLLGLVGVRGILVAIQNSAWNSWIRDLVPQNILGSFFGRRLMYSHGAAMVLGIAAGVFVDVWRGRTEGDTEALGYTFAILFGVLFFGLTGPVFRALAPEPLMQVPPSGRGSLWQTLSEPFKDPNYRQVIRFHFMWNLALHLAIPFFAVYMLVRLDLPLSLVMGLTALSQASNVFFLRFWGPLSDRTGAKAVLSVACSLYLLVILGWTFTTLPDRYFMTVPLLVVLHILAGAAAAGTGITSSTLSMKLAPEGRATGYMAAMSVAANMGAAIGPLLGGRLIDFFSVRSLALDFTWTDPSGVDRLPALNLTGFDFMFGLTFLLGLITLGGLTRVREEGEVSREVVLEALMAPMQRLTSPASSVPSLGLLTQFPYSYLRRAPVPGLDVALGVTAYQVAETMRVATAGAARGRRASQQISHAVEEAMREIVQVGGAAEHVLTGAALHAARGAMHSAAEMTDESSHIIEGVVRGLVRTLKGVGHARIEEVIKSASYGVVQGAIEAGTDPKQAASLAIAAARAMSAESGVNEETLVRVAATAAVSAAALNAPDAVEAVEESTRAARSEFEPSHDQ